MKRIFFKKIRLLLLTVLLLIASVLYSVQSITPISSPDSKESNMEEIKRKKIDYVDISYYQLISNNIFSGVSDDFYLDSTDIVILLIMLKNILSVFLKFMIALVLPVLLLTMRTIGISEAGSRLSSIIMHFYHLKGGKKDVPSYRFVF